MAVLVVTTLLTLWVLKRDHSMMAPRPVVHHLFHGLSLRNGLALFSLVVEPLQMLRSTNTDADTCTDKHTHARAHTQITHIAVYVPTCCRYTAPAHLYPRYGLEQIYPLVYLNHALLA